MQILGKTYSRSPRARRDERPPRMRKIAEAQGTAGVDARIER